MSNVEAWEIHDLERYRSYLTDAERNRILPPDLTPAGGCKGRWNGWLCTRSTDHTGRHAAGTGWHIIAVWP